MLETSDARFVQPEDHRAAQLAVLGSPIAHSQSPALHRAAYQWLGWNAEYHAIDVNATQLDSFLRTLGPTWRGLSLTMPLKRTILPYVTDFEPVAASTEVVNTVVFDDGHVYGANTDVQGIVKALDERTTPHGLVLGSGATATSAVAALHQLDVAHIGVASRRGTEIPSTFESFKIDAAVPLLEATAELGQAGIVISTLPAHVADSVVHLLPKDLQGKTLLDVAYDPWPSALASAWQARGGDVVSGLRMLVEQAFEQVRRFAPSYFPTSRTDIAALRSTMYKAVV